MEKSGGRKAERIRNGDVRWDDRQIDCEYYKAVPILSDEEQLRRVSEAYIKAFAGPPWFEYKRVREAGIANGAGTQPWRRIGTPGEIEKLEQDIVAGRVRKIDVENFYEPKAIAKALAMLIDVPGFIGFAFEIQRASDKCGADYTNVVGASWMILVEGISDSAKRDKVMRALDLAGVKGAKTAYGDETFVVPEMQGRGIGTALLEARRKAAESEGFEYVIFRTINPSMVRIYENVYGKGNVRLVMRDEEDERLREYYLVKCSMRAEDPNRLKLLRND